MYLQATTTYGSLIPGSKYIRAAGGLCVADEVQTGYGRVGTHFWAFESQDVIPDIVVLGKPIGNGHPLAAVITTPEIAAAFDTGMEFSSTFGGNTVSAAVGSAVLDVVLEEKLQDHALRVGRILLDGREQADAPGALSRHRRCPRLGIFPGRGARPGPRNFGARDRRGRPHRRAHAGRGDPFRHGRPLPQRSQDPPPHALRRGQRGPVPGLPRTGPLGRVRFLIVDQVIRPGVRHSYRRQSAGLIRAVFKTWKLTVPRATAKVTEDAARITRGSNDVR